MAHGGPTTAEIKLRLGESLSQTIRSTTESIVAQREREKQRKIDAEAREQLHSFKMKSLSEQISARKAMDEIRIGQLQGKFRDEDTLAMQTFKANEDQQIWQRGYDEDAMAMRDDHFNKQEKRINKQFRTSLKWDKKKWKRAKEDAEILFDRRNFESDRAYDTAIGQWEDEYDFKLVNFQENVRRYDTSLNVEMAKFDETMNYNRQRDQLNYALQQQSIMSANQEKMDKLASALPGENWKNPEAGDKGLGYNENEVLESANAYLDRLQVNRRNLIRLKQSDPSDPAVKNYSKQLKRIKKELKKGSGPIFGTFKPQFESRLIPGSEVNQTIDRVNQMLEYLE